MVKFAKGNREPISEEQLLGSFGEFRIGKTLKVGKEPTGYWASLRDADGGSAIFNVSRRVAKALDASLEGVEDKATRLAIVHSALDECTIVEVADRFAPAEGQTEGKQKLNDDGSPKMRWILTVQAGEGLTGAQVNASVAKAATFSIKSAMTNRI